MDAQDYAILVTALTGLVSALLSGLAAMYAAKAKSTTETTAKAVAVVQTQTNHMHDVIVKQSSDAAFAAGQAAQKKIAPPYPRE